MKIIHRFICNMCKKERSVYIEEKEECVFICCECIEKVSNFLEEAKNKGFIYTETKEVE